MKTNVAYFNNNIFFSFFKNIMEKSNRELDESLDSFTSWTVNVYCFLYSQINCFYIKIWVV